MEESGQHGSGDRPAAGTFEGVLTIGTRVQLTAAGGQRYRRQAGLRGKIVGFARGGPYVRVKFLGYRSIFVMWAGYFERLAKE